MAILSNNSEICAVVPFWSQSGAMNWDSNYAYLRRTLPALAKELPDWIWLVFWPRKDKGRGSWQWVDDGIFRIPNVYPVPWPYNTGMRDGVQSFDAETFAAIEQRFAPTVYWLNQVEMGIFIDGGYQHSFNTSARPAILAQHHYIIHPSLPYPIEQQVSRRLLQLGGSVVADRVVCNSQHCYQMLVESSGGFLSKDRTAKIMEKTYVEPFGLIEPETIPPLREYAKPVIVYNHRFENYKRPADTAEAIRQVRARGRDFEVWVTQTVGQKVGDFPVDRFVGAAEIGDYLKNIAVPAINTINSVHETYCISAVDSLMLGHLLVAPNSVTFPELVPDGYPYLFNNQTEQIEMLDAIMQDWANVFAKWSPILKAYAIEKFAIKGYASRYAAHLTSVAQIWRQVTPKDTTTANMERFYASLDSGTYPLGKFMTAVQKATKLGHQAMPARRVVRETSLRGGVMRYTGGQIVVDWRRS